MKNLAHTCMQWISEYRRETALSISFLLSGIVPPALYFITSLLIAKLGNSVEIADYALVYAIFNVCISIPIGFLPAVQFFAAKYKQKTENSVLQSSLLLMLMLTVASTIGFVLYVNSFISNKVTASKLIVYPLICAIVPVSCYMTAAAYNEGANRVKINNIINLLSIPLFTIFFLFFYLYLNVSTSCALAFFTTRFIMLVLMLASMVSFLMVAKPTKIDIKNIFTFGFPIAVVFFLQKMLLTGLSIILRDKSIELAAYHMVGSFSLIFSVLSSSMAAQIFICLAKKSTKIISCVLICLFNLLIIYLVTIVIGNELICAALLNIIKDPQVSNTIVTHYPLVAVFILSEMLIVAIMIINRGIGDTWRLRVLWITALSGSLAFYYHNPSFKLAMILNTSINLAIFLGGLLWLISKWPGISRKFHLQVLEGR